MRKSFTVLALCACLALPLSGCSFFGSSEKLDLSSVHTTAAESVSPSGETMESQEETLTITLEKKTSAPETSAIQPSETSAETAKKVSFSIHTFTQGKASVEYPSISGLEDSQKETSVNRLLKANAVSILDAYEIDTEKDSLSVRCEVTGADRRRVTAVYTGSLSSADSAYPVRVFYTNAVDVSRVSDLGLSDYVDTAAAAAYVLSPDCHFLLEDEELRKAVLEYRDTQTAEYYTALFSAADFPLDTADTNLSGAAAFPGSFSYERQGVIYISIPAPHALGDYALLKYIPDTK